jgi:hypothetical protein
MAIVTNFGMVFVGRVELGEFPVSNFQIGATVNVWELQEVVLEIIMLAVALESNIAV